jgi:hypothetical protein
MLGSIAVQPKRDQHILRGASSRNYLIHQGIAFMPKLTLRTLSGGNTRANELEEQIDEWISRPEIDLLFDPFRERDAGGDARLPRYLVGHDAFTTLWGDWPTILYATAGGGKTAFRVRLAYACRAGEGGRRIFCINLPLLDPEISLLGQILSTGANELLLHLLYNPQLFFTQSSKTQQAIATVLHTNLSPTFDYRMDKTEDLLSQIEQDDTWDQLAETFDPAAQGLFLPPDFRLLQKLLDTLRDGASIETKREITSEQHWQKLIQLTRQLDFEATYILIDGVDAYLETQQEPNLAAAVLQPFLEQAAIWQEQQIYFKFFLPAELESLIRAFLPSSLLENSRIKVITWDENSLRDMLRQRLLVASGGNRAISSLDALSTPNLRDIESQVIGVAKPLPRHLILLIEQIFIEHIRRQGSRGRLEPEDVEAAIEWYQRLAGDNQRFHILVTGRRQ